MLQQTIIHSVTHLINQLIKSVSTVSVRPSMRQRARPCARIGVQGLQCAPMRLLVQPCLLGQSCHVTIAYYSLKDGITYAVKYTDIFGNCSSISFLFSQQNYNKNSRGKS